jgi:outer membrane protein OmpA-like peptidoglycan-associated protein
MNRITRKTNMNHPRFFALTLVSLAVIAGCSTVPANNAMLEQARSDYRTMQDNPRARDLAAIELKQAGDALAKANEAWARKDDTAEVDHLAYLAKQRVAIAQETAARKTAESAVADANSARDKLRLAARTAEADAATRTAESAQRNSEEARRQAEAAQRQAAVSNRAALDTQARNSQLEAQIKELNASKTERGLVVTIGDVLFDTGKAQLKPSGMRNVEKLVAFLKQYPQRSALVEGYTDNVGSGDSNQGLSSRRADAVRMALVDMGVGASRIATRGYGEEHPVASNDSNDGRQLNRRVEIVVSEDNAVVAPR